MGHTTQDISILSPKRDRSTKRVNDGNGTKVEHCIFGKALFFSLVQVFPKNVLFGIGNLSQPILEKVERKNNDSTSPLCENQPLFTVFIGPVCFRRASSTRTGHVCLFTADPEEARGVKETRQKQDNGGGMCKRARSVMVGGRGGGGRGGEREPKKPDALPFLLFEMIFSKQSCLGVVLLLYIIFMPGVFTKSRMKVLVR